jgi:hypothetical protein
MRERKEEGRKEGREGGRERKNTPGMWAELNIKTHE